MIRIVRSAIGAASPGGKTWNYFHKERSREANMRSVFSWIKPAISHDRESARCHAFVLLYQMGDWYKAIWENTKLDFSVFYEGIYEAVGKRGWWHSPPPPLFGSSDEEAGEIAAVVRDAIAHFRKQGDNRNYSLATKWLHLCFPEVFAIFDRYACASIADVIHRIDLGPSHSGLSRGQFLSRRMSETNGDGYIGLLNFYRCFWSVACVSGLESQLLVAADQNQALLRNEPGCGTAIVSTLDILDKPLWMATGYTAPLVALDHGPSCRGPMGP
jgi:hypothetical protein